MAQVINSYRRVIVKGFVTAVNFKFALGIGKEER